MRILLTGSSGMVGRNLQAHPVSAEHSWITPSSSELNLLDASKVRAFLTDARPDLVIHCAGKVGGIRANMSDPLAFCYENVTMGSNLVKGAFDAGVRAFLNLASSCMYPRDAPNPLREELILSGPLEPTNEGYALAKIVVSRLCQYIDRTHPELHYKTVIPCNLYGPWDKFDPFHGHMIPAVIRKLHEAKGAGVETIDIWGDGTARREFLYTGDLAELLLGWCVPRMARLPEVMNAGVGRDYSINEYYEVIAKVVGYEGGFTHDLSKPVGMKKKLVDISRQEQLGWTARTSLEDGIAKTYKFFLKYEEKA